MAHQSTPRPARRIERLRKMAAESVCLRNQAKTMRDAMEDAVTELERGRPSRARDILRAAIRTKIVVVSE